MFNIFEQIQFLSLSHVQFIYKILIKGPEKIDFSLFFHSPNFIKRKYKVVNTSTIRKTIGNNLNFCFSARTNISSAVIKLFNDSKIIFCNCYSMTESGGTITWNLGKTEAERTNSSIGTIESSSCKIEILSQSGEIVIKDVGKLLISGKRVFTSILKNRKKFIVLL